ncbi:hypothetical protein [Leptolyngbya sp. FACHB-261]|uniref:hypothetical protein n=1 Tax=Leptolyngbya sp. FACHB-261 TaxID=2692806 RepID=UPI0018EFCDE7
MQSGRWSLEGNWLERDGMPLLVRGRTLVVWSRDAWFSMVTKLVFPDPEAEREEIALQYKGRLDSAERQYTFVLQHSQLGRIEGEGWVAPDSIVQRYWVLNDRQRRSGFETLRRLDEDHYHVSSGIMAGHYLISIMEANLERQPEAQ